MTAAVESMAYVGATPWHGLGNVLTEKATIDTWRTEAGLDWEAISTPVVYQAGEQAYAMDDKSVLYRSDTHVPLGVVSPQFKIVQPADVMEFFRDLTELGDFRMETAGVLFGGKRIWALARHDREAAISKDDKVRPYLLLATGLDGTMSTHASFTTVRVVCNNTLQMALQNGNDQIKVTHRSEFQEKHVKQELNLVDDKFDHFLETADILASKKVTQKQVRDLYGTILVGDKYEEEEYLDARLLNLAMDTYQSFPGQDTIAARDTAWGAVNGMTAFLDHVRNTKTVDSRLNSTWFGEGKDIKQRTVAAALEL